MDYNNHPLTFNQCLLTGLKEFLLEASDEIRWLKDTSITKYSECEGIKKNLSQLRSKFVETKTRLELTISNLQTEVITQQKDLGDKENEIINFTLNVNQLTALIAEKSKENETLKNENKKLSKRSQALERRFKQQQSLKKKAARSVARNPFLGPNRSNFDSFLDAYGSGEEPSTSVQANDKTKMTNSQKLHSNNDVKLIDHQNQSSTRPEFHSTTHDSKQAGSKFDNCAVEKLLQDWCPSVADGQQILEVTMKDDHFRFAEVLEPKTYSLEASQRERRLKPVKKSTCDQKILEMSNKGSESKQIETLTTTTATTFEGSKIELGLERPDKVTPTIDAELSAVNKSKPAYISNATAAGIFEENKDASRPEVTTLTIDAELIPIANKESEFKKPETLIAAYTTTSEVNKDETKFERPEQFTPLISAPLIPTENKEIESRSEQECTREIIVEQPPVACNDASNILNLLNTFKVSYDIMMAERIILAEFNEKIMNENIDYDESPVGREIEIAREASQPSLDASEVDKLGGINDTLKLEDLRDGDNMIEDEAALKSNEVACETSQFCVNRNLDTQEVDNACGVDDTMKEENPLKTNDVVCEVSQPYVDINRNTQEVDKSGGMDGMLEVEGPLKTNENPSPSIDSPGAVLQEQKESSGIFSDELNESVVLAELEKPSQDEERFECSQKNGSRMDCEAESWFTCSSQSNEETKLCQLADEPLINYRRYEFRDGINRDCFKRKLNSISPDEENYSESVDVPVASSSVTLDLAPEDKVPVTKKMKRCLPKIHPKKLKAKKSVSADHFEEVWSVLKTLNIPLPNGSEKVEDVSLVTCEGNLLRQAFFKTVKDTNTVFPKEQMLNFDGVKRAFEYFRGRRQRASRKLALNDFVNAAKLSNRSTICSALECVFLNSIKSILEEAGEDIFEDVLALCNAVEKRRFPGFVNSMKIYLKSKIFSAFVYKINKTGHNAISCNILRTRLYTSLCKSTVNSEDALDLLYEGLMLTKRAYPIAYGVFQEWPDILSSNSHKTGLLIEMIQLCIMTDHKLANVREFYNVKMDQKTDKEYAKEIMLKMDDVCWVEAITLLCKKHLFVWSYKNVITKYLLPLLRMQNVDCVHDALLVKAVRALDIILQSCPTRPDQLDTFNIKNIVKLISDVMSNNDSSRELQETCCVTICQLSTWEFAVCSELLSSWVPPNRSTSSSVVDKLHEVMTKPAICTDWLAFLDPNLYPTIKLRKKRRIMTRTSVVNWEDDDEKCNKDNIPRSVHAARACTKITTYSS